MQLQLDRWDKITRLIINDFNKLSLQLSAPLSVYNSERTLIGNVTDIR